MTAYVGASRGIYSYSSSRPYTISINKPSAQAPTKAPINASITSSTKAPIKSLPRASNKASIKAFSEVANVASAKASTEVADVASTKACTEVANEASTKASTQVSDEAINIAPIPSSKLLEGFRDQIQTFSSIAGLRDAVNTLSDRLYQGTTTDQYLVLQPVTEDDFAEFENTRFTIHKGLRITYCTDIDALIIKVPTAHHEVANGTVAQDFLVRIMHMGFTGLTDLKNMCSTIYQGISVKKEPDSCWKPLTIRPKMYDWPTLVFEVGVSQTLDNLRTAAEWWLSNTQGQVNIVVLIKLHPAAKTIHIERWERRPAPPTRPATRSTQPTAQVTTQSATQVHTQPATQVTTQSVTQFPTQPVTQIPTQIQTIDIDINGNITGSPPATTPPLVLHFEDIVLRPPVPPEQDIIYTAQDLQSLASNIWFALQ